MFFRASTQEKAKALSIRGWVHNEPDGSVLIQAEGKEEVLQKFIEWCHYGPPQAKVDEVVVTEKNEEGFADFEIRQ